jgi:bifunctional non-homologous end joining protein LigD
MTDLRPMLAVSAASLPTGADWTYEVKWDGYRALAIKEGRRVRLLSRNQEASFQALQHRATTDLALVYYAFDLLELDGKAWTRQPLEARRQQLASVVAGSHVLLSEPVSGTVSEIERTLREHGLEGVIVRRRQSVTDPVSDPATGLSL